MHILTGYRNSPTSTSLNYNADNFIIFYVYSVAAIHSSCTMGETNIKFSETELHVNHTDSCSIPFIVDMVFPFWPCTVVYVPPPGTQQSSSFNISPPSGWVSVMTGFTQNQIDNGEEFKSVHILLKAEWFELKNCVEFNWLSYLATQGKPEIHERLNRLEETNKAAKVKWFTS